MYGLLIYSTGSGNCPWFYV